MKTETIVEKLPFGTDSDEEKGALWREALLKKASISNNEMNEQVKMIKYHVMATHICISSQLTSVNSTVDKDKLNLSAM